MLFGSSNDNGNGNVISGSVNCYKMREKRHLFSWRRISALQVGEIDNTKRGGGIRLYNPISIHGAMDCMLVQSKTKKNEHILSFRASYS